LDDDPAPTAMSGTRAEPAMRAEDSVLSDEHVGRRVIRGGTQRALGFLLSNVLTAVGAVILLRYLGVGRFGRYGTVLALVGIVYGVSEAGLTATGSRELSLCENDAQRRDVLGHILGLRIVITGVGLCGAVVFALVAGYATELVVGTVLAGIGTFLASVQSAMLLPLIVEMRNVPVALTEVLRQGTLAACFALLALAGAGLVPFFAVQIVVALVLLAATPLMLRQRHLVLPQLTAERTRALIGIALPVAIATVLAVLYLRILVVMMSLLSSSAHQIGYYVASTRVVELVGGIPFFVVSVVLPVVSVAARDDHERLVYMTARIADVMMIAGVFISLGLWALATPLMEVFGGAQYKPAAPVLEIQCFAAVTFFLTAAWQPALMAMNRIRSFTVAMTVGVTALVGSAAALIPAFEAQGAAVAAVIGDVALCVAVYVAVRRAGPGAWLHFGTAARVAVAAGASVGVGLIPGVPTVARAAAVGLVFVVCVLALRAVPSEIVDALRGVASRLTGRPAN
jgi:O-antigen/teichoic acid export membrane protein